MLGRGPKVINARPNPESSRCGAEARKQYMRGRSPKVGPKPDAVNAGPKPYAVNAGPKPDAGQKPKSWAKALCSKCWAEARCGAKPKSGAEARCGAGARCGCHLVGDFLQWKKETMKEHELFAIPIQGCREANWPGRCCANPPRDVHRYVEHACMSWCKHVWTCVRRTRLLVDARGHAEGRASDHAVTLSVRKKLVLVAGLDSASSHSTSRYGEVKTASGLPAKVGTTRLSWGVGGRDGLGFWSQHISLWRSEDRKWPTREGWHNSSVVAAAVQA
ncbi:hypothetical protein CDL15_Pgr026301 [Punica granatum]|uniref:Uncharacterized protein n=1 Tax=Punica granatum TaxID=22663 RepID=A0A218XWH3_PUNGR|nr:hypothetical protein CDL15_Pgr026301 [Punica granatum]